MKVIYLSQDRILLHQEKKKLQKMVEAAFREKQPLSGDEILEQCRRVNEVIERLAVQEGSGQSTDGELWEETG